MTGNVVEVKTRIPEKAAQFVSELVERGFGIGHFDLELGISELELTSSTKRRDNNEE